jgi:hypothetical protein
MQVSGPYSCAILSYVDADHAALVTLPPVTIMRREGSFVHPERRLDFSYARK